MKLDLSIELDISVVYPHIQATHSISKKRRRQQQQKHGRTRRIIRTRRWWWIDWRLNSNRSTILCRWFDHWLVSIYSLIRNESTELVNECFIFCDNVPKYKIKFFLKKKISCHIKSHKLFSCGMASALPVSTICVPIIYCCGQSSAWRDRKPVFVFYG